MKKSFALAAAAATLCLSTSASALDTEEELGRAVITGTNTELAAPGGDIVALGQMGQYCYYAFEWLNPEDDEDVAVCTIRERRPFGVSCADASLNDIDTFVESVNGECEGYNAAGAGVQVRLQLVESSLGAARMSGLAFLGNALAAIPIEFA